MDKNRVYGYCRISTKKQSIDRQERNIKSEFPTAIIVKEEFTGTKTSRPEWNKLYRKLKSGDAVIFDSVSRMSRNATEGFALYKNLNDKGISLVFLKERHIDTNAYKEAAQGIISAEISSGDNATDNLVNSIMQAVNIFMLNKVEADIFKAFEQSEKEVLDLHQRTKEGLETARRNGKQIGQRKGATLNVKKANSSKEIIRKHSKDFGGSLNDKELVKMLGISRNSFYKYKRELKEI